VTPGHSDEPLGIIGLLIMNNHVRDAKFYVVGGPVQPGRDCYLHR